MPFRVTRFEPTPNPNAIKCVLDQRIVPEGEAPRSYRASDDATGDSLARALFALEPIGTVTSVLMNADWITVNKSPEAAWPKLKKDVERVLAGVH